MENQIENYGEYCEELADAIWCDHSGLVKWTTNCLVKKHKRGIVPIYAQLVYSSIVKKIVRDEAKENKISLTKKERKALHIYTAELILQRFEAITNANVERVAV